MTVGEVIKRIQKIKKDIEYVVGLQEKWREQKERFPKIYEGIQEQEKYFLHKIEELKNLKVTVSSAETHKKIEQAIIKPAAKPGEAKSTTKEKTAEVVGKKVEKEKKAEGKKEEEKETEVKAVVKKPGKKPSDKLKVKIR
jgi:hypothetical protein